MIVYKIDAVHKVVLPWACRHEYLYEKKDTKTQLQITYRTVAMNNEKQLQKMNNRTSFSEKKLTLIAKYMTEQLQMIAAPNCKVQDRAIASE